MTERKVVVSLAVLALSFGAGPAWSSVMDAAVAYVVDGGTAVLDDGQTVRYIGVDAPDPGTKGQRAEPFGKEAFELNRRLVAGKRVRLEFDSKERNDRGELQAYVYVDKYFVNASMLQSGFARAAVRSPNTRHAGLFERLQAEAKEAKRGLWKLPRVAPPTFGNSDLKKSGETRADVLTNRDLEKYDVPGEAEVAPADGAGDDGGAPPAPVDDGEQAERVPPRKEP